MHVLTFLQISKLLIFVLMLSCGQILFKKVALEGPQNFLSLSGLLQLALYPWFWLSLFLYGAATLLWIHILQSVPLSLAYPFVALGFILVPLAAYFLYKELIDLRIILGSAVIIGGLLIMHLRV